MRTTKQIACAAASRSILVVAAMLFQAGHVAAQQVDDDQAFAGLRAADERLAVSVFRLAVANDALCLDHLPATGLVLHELASYDPDVRAEAKRYFGLATAVGVEAVVPGSPAALAGIRPNDSIAAVDNVAVGDDGALAMVRNALDKTVGSGVSITVLREGQEKNFLVHPVSACDARGEVKVSDDLNAETDGDIIQVDSGLMNLVADPQEFAAVVAHELAHVVLRHPQRLTDAHVSRGLLRGFGRNARLIKRTESEADRLSVTLMANAGYDPQAAVRYWQNYGPQLNDHGGFGSTHLAWQARVKLMTAAVGDIPPHASLPIIPSWIADRKKPLD
jgi:membrane-associated protease RseP (regulator of RpoE activity)